MLAIPELEDEGMRLAGVLIKEGDFLYIKNSPELGALRVAKTWLLTSSVDLEYFNPVTFDVYIRKPVHLLSWLPNKPVLL